MGWADNGLRGQAQCNIGEFYIAPHIRLYQLSEMGNQQVHTFVLNDREVLIVQMAGMHAKWVRLRQNWEDTHFMQAGQAVGTPVVGRDWQRLQAAMDSGIKQLPAEAIASVRQLVHSLFTWEGFLLILAVTALFVLGGEVALLLLGAVAIYDLLMNVLPLLVQFYHAAIAATTPEETEAAGKLFAQALLNGALDVISIYFAVGAYRSLLLAGGGRITFRGVIVYLVERSRMLMARLAQGAGKLKQIVEEAREAAKKKEQAEPKWVDENGNILWPPNDGFAGVPKPVTLQPGMKIDRYGYDGGTFVSPAGESYAGRSLAPGTENKPYTVFEVLKPIDATGGKVAPWFGQPGGNTQYKLSQSMDELIKGGYIKVVTRTQPK